jgi:hypothetical protein
MATPCFGTVAFIRLSSYIATGKTVLLINSKLPSGEFGNMVLPIFLFRVKKNRLITRLRTII